MLNNILRLREVRVEDVMVPRADIEAVEITTTLGDLMELFEQSGHSRMPVYAETLDDPRGMVHIRDVAAHITRSPRVKKGRVDAQDAGRRADSTSPSVDLARTHRRTQPDPAGAVRAAVDARLRPDGRACRRRARRWRWSSTNMAAPTGLVSLEDIVEMVVGDIEDEHDDDEPMITQSRRRRVRRRRQGRDRRGRQDDRRAIRRRRAWRDMSIRSAA